MFYTFEHLIEFKFCMIVAHVDTIMNRMLNVTSAYIYYSEKIIDAFPASAKNKTHTI